MTTAQASHGMRPPMTGATFQQSATGLYSIPGYINGATQGTIGRIGPGTASSAGSGAGAPTIVIHNSIPGAEVGNYLNGKIITTVSNNPRVVSTASAAGMRASASRREQTIAQISPGLITS